MSNRTLTGVDAGRSSDRDGRARRLCRLTVTGLLATPAAMVTVVCAAALARAAGVDFVVAEGEGAIPLSGFAVVTGFFSVLGVATAAVLVLWSSRPAERFVWTAGALIVLSSVPPVLSGADVAATIALIGLHLAAAAVMIPALTRSLAGAR